MENETKAPPPVSPGDSAARLHVHLSLAAVVVPFMSVVLGAILAVVGRPTGPPSPEQRRWRRYLLALLAFDLVVAACIGWVMADPDRFEQPEKESPSPRIGIFFSPDPADTEARVHAVLPGSPAERAGLQAGDLVQAIDGAGVDSHPALREDIKTGEPGKPRTLTILRGGKPLDVAVVPELPKKETRGLFEPRPGSESASKTEWLVGGAAFLPALAAAGITALVSRLRRRARVVVWRGFLLAMVGSVGAGVGVGYLIKALQGGWSLGALLLSLLAQMVALLGLTALARAWCGRDVPAPIDPLPPLSGVRATLLGCFYIVTLGIRTSVVLITLDQILTGGASAAKTQSIEALASAPLGVWGTLLFIATIAVVGPLAEEAIFRGFLLPRLAGQWSSTAGNAVSSLIFALCHPHYGMLVPIVFLYGWVFGWARLRTGGIGVPFVLHMTVNGVVSLVLLSRT